MSKKRKKSDQPERLSSARWVILVVLGFSGAAALIYEVVWTRVLSLVFGSSVYAVSTMLTAFMTGLALGSFLGGRLADRSKNHFFIFGLIEIGIGVFGILSVFMIDKSQLLYFQLYQLAGRQFGVFIFGQFLIGLIIMVIPTTLMGATFPIASKIYTREIKFLGKKIGDLYSVNTLGSIAGSFAAGFVMMPMLGLNKTALAAAIINIFAGGLILILEKKFSSMVAGTMIFFLLFIAIAVKQTDHYSYNVHTIGLFNSVEDFVSFKSSLKNLFYSEDVNGQVGVFRDSLTGRKFLRVSGRVEGSDSSSDMPAQVLSGRLPVEYFRKAKKALVIGLGTGITLSNVAKYQNLEKIDCVEINSSVLRASKIFFKRETNDVFSDPRVKVEIADGRNYLLVGEKKYDVISSEPSYPTSQAVANLFTEEFYELAKKRLESKGILCQWAPKYIFSFNEYKILVKTMGRIFENIVVVDMGGDALFLCSDSEISADKVRVMTEQLSRKENLRLKLNEFHVWKIDAKLKAKLEKDSGIPVNTDNNAILEYRAIRNILINPPATL